MSIHDTIRIMSDPAVPVGSFRLQCNIPELKSYAFILGQRLAAGFCSRSAVERSLRGMLEHIVINDFPLTDGRIVLMLAPQES